MVEALNRINQFHGPAAKAIVWEHNTHIGDARATDMEAEGMVNVGQLVREQYGEKRVFAVGFGSHRGTVIAADQWGGESKRMRVPEGVPGSWEDLLYRAGPEDKIMLFDKNNEYLLEPLGHRAIGVVYNPRYERGNYVPSVIPNRYDAFVYVDKSNALTLLEQEALHL
jgi:erythromycin esterase-like protein